MENMKFGLVTEVVDGKTVRKWVPADKVPEPECHLYGDYLTCGKDVIRETKKELIETVFDVIREVAEDDRFWIVKDADEEGKVTVGWKIDFPQMYGKKCEDVKIVVLHEIEEPANELMWTAELMGSADYKERFVAEYYQTKIRYEKLHEMCIRYEAGTLDFEPTCSLELLTKQMAAMGQYLHCLEVRAQIEGIEL